MAGRHTNELGLRTYNCDNTNPSISTRSRLFCVSVCLCLSLFVPVCIFLSPPPPPPPPPPQCLFPYSPCKCVSEFALSFTVYLCIPLTACLSASACLHSSLPPFLISFCLSAACLSLPVSLSVTLSSLSRSPMNSPHKGQWCGALMFLWSAPEQTIE